MSEKYHSTEWKEETVVHSSSLTGFLRLHINDLKSDTAGVGRYNSVTELHFSGTNSEPLSAITTGTLATAKRVDVFYNGETVEQIHAVYNTTTSNGQDLDVYLKGHALSDYLASIQK